MFGIFTGVIANAAMVIAGSAIGCIFKTEKLKTIGERIFQAFACFVMVLGISGSIELSQPIFILISLILGIAIGELLDIDARFNALGDSMQRRFAANSSDGSFSEGFVSASLLFCIGSMTIMGGLQSGLENIHTIYYTKGVIDGVTAITFAMSSGIAVAFSALSITVYQGLLTLSASFIAPYLSPEIISISTQVGSLTLIALSFNMLGLTKIKVANFLPAMFVPMIWCILGLPVPAI